MTIKATATVLAAVVATSLGGCGATVSLGAFKTGLGSTQLGMVAPADYRPPSRLTTERPAQRRDAYRECFSRTARGSKDAALTYCLHNIEEERLITANIKAESESHRPSNEIKKSEVWK